MVAEAADDVEVADVDEAVDGAVATEVQVMCWNKTTH